MVRPHLFADATDAGLPQRLFSVLGDCIPNDAYAYVRRVANPWFTLHRKKNATGFQ